MKRITPPLHIVKMSDKEYEKGKKRSRTREGDRALNDLLEHGTEGKRERKAAPSNKKFQRVEQVSGGGMKPDKATNAVSANAEIGEASRNTAPLPPPQHIPRAIPLEAPAKIALDIIPTDANLMKYSWDWNPVLSKYYNDFEVVRTNGYETFGRLGMLAKMSSPLSWTNQKVLIENIKQKYPESFHDNTGKVNSFQPAKQGNATYKQCYCATYAAHLDQAKSNTEGRRLVIVVNGIFPECEAIADMITATVSCEGAGRIYPNVCLYSEGCPTCHCYTEIKGVIDAAQKKINLFMIETSKPSKVVEASAIEKNHLLTLQAIDKVRKQEIEDTQKLKQQVAKMSVEMKGLSEAFIGLHEENKKLLSQNKTLMLLEKTRNVKMEGYIPTDILKTIRGTRGSGTDETVDMKRKIEDMSNKHVNDMVLHMFKQTLDGKVDETRKFLRDFVQANAEVPIAQKQIAPNEDVVGTASRGSEGTTTAPAGSVGTTTAPAGSVKATTPPAGSVKTTTAPAGSAGTTTPPAGSVGTTTPPAGSVKTTTAPAGSVKATTPPAGSVKTTTAPAGSAGTTTAPAGSEGTKTPPAGSVKTTTSPAGSAGTTTAPAGSVGTTIPPRNGLFTKMFAIFEKD